MRGHASGIVILLGILFLLIIGNPRNVSAQVQAGKEQEGYITQVEFPSEETEKSWRSLRESLPFELHGFLEARGGLRTQNDPHESKTATLGETRFQLNLSKALDWANFRIKSDFLYDGVVEGADVDLREANAILTPFEFTDFKIGRQILTWGTGDYIFINDLFPKDYNSFFIGRDDEYLKAPSDALKSSFYTKALNIDFVYTPRFNPDRFIDGKRLSYFNPQLGRLAGEDAKVRPKKRDEWFEDDEIALRLYRNIKGYDLALYGYNGFWKNPMGFDPQTGKATFPRLSVYGLSARGKVWKGIGNIEMGYYDSRDDRSGKDPFIPNSQLRFLAGYEQELAKDFTVGMQYYLELMSDYGAYKRTLPPGSQAADEYRHVITLRLTKLLMYQNLRLSLFTFYSPSDQDAYVRPNIHYKITDHWSAEAGANIFFGKKDHTFFGQFKDNTNVYLGLRWSF
ncbi:MAG: hypothetical protein AB1502_05940 [Thermodesulfobacteriota bacterium]